MLETSDTSAGRLSPFLADSDSALGAVFETMAEGVVLQNRDGLIIGCNRSAERILGLTFNQMRGRTSMDPRWQAIREDGSPFPGEDHPAMVTLRTGEPCSDVIMGVRRPDSTSTWIIINSAPLGGTEGEEPNAVITTFSEVARLREGSGSSAEDLGLAVAARSDEFLPICANCKNVRSPENGWEGIEDYFMKALGTKFTHTICPTCAAELYDDLDEQDD